MNMTFDLHLHSKFSDGSLTLENAGHYLEGHYEYRTVTDHNKAEFHRKFPNFCSFTGMEIFSYFELDGERSMAELLLFGFDAEHVLIKKVEKYRQGEFPLLSIQQLSQYLQPLKDDGALIFLAHPSATYEEREKRSKILNAILPYVHGFECLHSCFERQDALWILNFCKENGKLATGGSDSHNVPLFETPHLEFVQQYEELFSWVPELARLYRKVQESTAN